VRLILDVAPGGDLRAGLAINVGHGESPERNELDSGDELGGEGGQELPVKAEEPCEQAADAEIDDVVWGRCAAFDDKWEDRELQDVGRDGQDHGDAQARTGRDFDGAGIGVSGHGLHIQGSAGRQGAREQGNREKSKTIEWSEITPIVEGC